MKKFLQRDFLGFPVWGWLVLGAILAFYLKELYLLFFGTVPAAVALHQASQEAQDRADALIQTSIKSEQELDDKTQETAIEGTNAAEEAVVASQAQQDDLNDPFMD